MKIIRYIPGILFFALVTGCTPLDKIYSHEFSSGYFRLKAPETTPEKVYLNKIDDSLVVYPLIHEGKSRIPDKSKSQGINISSVIPGSYLYNSTFVKTSLDVDLSTVLLKLRPQMADVSPQLNANINGIFYVGFRKDFFRLKTGFSKLKQVNTFVRHTGFDFGPFAGIGIAQISPTVTKNRTAQEYDGIVFQKGFSVFATYENMSVGLAVGFDNLLGENKNIWIYNNKPWFGLVLGIANF
jgi:hypothetical protein